ncbi:hypothetical protein ACHAXH_007235 [Discostella pseudostelligera]
MPNCIGRSGRERAVVETPQLCRIRGVWTCDAIRSSQGWHILSPVYY